MGDILELTRIEANKLTIEKSPFSLTETMDLVEQLFRTQCEQKGLALKLHVDEKIPKTLLGDSTRLMQILNNLVGNAIKFTETGKVGVDAFSMPCNQPGKCRILFTVSDTGIGIDDNRLDYLFKTFTQADQGYTRKYQGAGLGLPIVKSLVALMGGGISVASEVGTGTTFHFHLTFERSADDPAKIDSNPLITDIDTPPMKVLVAEDDHANLLALVKLLEKNNYSVATATNGEEVLELLRGNEFDMILMDIQMPGMNGLEATRAIRNGEAGPGKLNIPIVALTAYAMAGDKKKILEAGMDEYLSKPMDIMEFRNMLERIAQRISGVEPSESLH